MTNAELIEFYENIDKLTSFTRIRKVYDLTNNLDIYLLRFLRRDFFKYHFIKVRNELLGSPKNKHEDIHSVFGAILNDDSFMYYYEDACTIFLNHFDSHYLDDISEKIDDFFSELDELERIGFSKLKNGEENNTKEPVELYDELLDDYSVPLIRRIVYLEKLGIIDFLRKERPFNTSVNSIANILGSIVDAKPSSIQPLLNPLLSKDLDNKNNPLNSAKNVMAVETHLMKIGYSIKLSMDNKN